MFLPRMALVMSYVTMIVYLFAMVCMRVCVMLLSCRTLVLSFVKFFLSSPCRVWHLICHVWVMWRDFAIRDIVFVMLVSCLIYVLS